MCERGDDDLSAAVALVLDVASITDFQPITRDTALDAAEAASAHALATGGVPELLPINHPAGNRFEMVTPTVID